MQQLKAAVVCMLVFYLIIMRMAFMHDSLLANDMNIMLCRHFIISVAGLNIHL